MKTSIYNLLVAIVLIMPFELSSANDKVKRPVASSTTFKISQKLGNNTSQKIVVISTRHFEPEADAIIMRGVHPKRELFYFVVAKSADTATIIQYPDLESAMEVFKAENEFLFFVHGHGKSFEQVVDRGFEVGSRYGTNMIMFDWPTDYYAIKKTIRNARKVTASFVQLSLDLNQHLIYNNPDSKTSIVFHSMGNRIIKKAVKKDLLGSLPENSFENIILNAAAVKQKGHSKWINQLNIQEQIYIVSNEGDWPLKGVRLMRFAEQLGSGYSTPLAKNATYINFSEIATKEHNLFLGLTSVEKEHPNVFDFYNHVFNNQTIDLNNKTDFAESSLPGLFFIL